jgi:KUP system potassium uptake protein
MTAADDMLKPIAGTRKLSALTLAALGVVYGDIGTSPLYALRECFTASHGVPLTPDNVLGVLSLIIWSLILVVTIKYIVFVMRADHEGEGGVLALMTLSGRQQDRGTRKSLGVVVVWGLIGAAFLYGDGIITPAISVLSAVEGLEIATPVLKPYVTLITIVILTVLFLFQSRGTGRLGSIFGPVVVVWFATLAMLGIGSLVQTPSILLAVNPMHGLRLFTDNPGAAFPVLGGVFLVLTGAEALYADMGHFGKRPIRVGWFTMVLPALILQYLGQGALLIRDPAALANPFYHLAPTWSLYPLVALATVATVIASQAMITGAFSLTHQAVQLGYLPYLRIQHTSGEQIGQIFVPGVNYALLVGTVGLVLAFGSSSRLAAAYGIAVSATMLITTLLMYRVVRHVWAWKLPPAVGLIAVFVAVDLAFFAANALKIPHGGWLPLVLGVAVFTLMTTWYRGRALVAGHLQAAAPPLEEFMSIVAPTTARVPGHAVFLTQNPGVTPLAFVQNVKHNKVLHQRIHFLTVLTKTIPHVPLGQRLVVKSMGESSRHVIVNYGFMDKPDVPKVCFASGKHGLDIPFADTTFFLSRLTFLATPKPGMAIWREKIFVFLSRNTQRASSYFQLPSEQVVEIGLVLEI